MYLACQRDDLREALTALGRTVLIKPTLPILTHVLCEARQGQLVMTTTNMDIATRCSIPALVQREGTVCVPAKLLTDLIKNEPGHTINLRREGKILTIESFDGIWEKSLTHLKGMNPSDFPTFPVISQDSHTLTLDSRLLKSMVLAVAPLAESEKTGGFGSIMGNVLVSIHDGRISLVASDRYRIATFTLPAREGSYDALIAKESLLKIAKMLPEEGRVQLVLGEESIKVVMEGMSILTRVSHKEYPNHQEILGGTMTTTIQVDRAKLLKALKRVGKFTEERRAYGDVYSLQMETVGSTLVFSPRRKKEEVETSSVKLEGTITGSPALYSFERVWLTELLEKLGGVGTVVIEIVEEKEMFRVRPLIPSGLVYAMKAENSMKIEQKNDEKKEESSRSS